MDSDFYLNTKNMDSVIDKVQKIAQLMETTKQNYRSQLTDQTKEWIGKSRNMFDRRSAELLRTLTDVSQSFYQIAEDLQTAANAYHEQDMLNAKDVDGRTVRY